MNLHASSGPLLQYLKAIASRWMGRLPPSDRPPDDPFSGVREPKPYAPSGRHSSAAVDEPEHEILTNAAGRTRR
jgi:hypothetical protein